MLLGNQQQYTRDMLCYRIYIFDVAQQGLTTSELVIRHYGQTPEELVVQLPLRTFMPGRMFRNIRHPFVGGAGMAGIGW